MPSMLDGTPAPTNVQPTMPRSISESPMSRISTPPTTHAPAVDTSNPNDRQSSGVSATSSQAMASGFDLEFVDEVT